MFALSKQSILISYYKQQGNFMKKLAIAVLMSAFASPLWAADMQCQIGPQVEIGHCDTMIWGQAYAPASFSVVNISKPVSQVIWNKPTACKNQGTYCSFKARSMLTYMGEALVLYTDGTYEKVSGSLRFEDGR